MKSTKMTYIMLDAWEHIEAGQGMMLTLCAYYVPIKLFARLRK